MSSLTKKQRKALRQYRREHELKPYQAELIRLQQYLEERQQRMIILFEGRDAAGKSGVIRYAMLRRTSTIHAPWVITRSDDKHKARLNAMKLILNTVPYDKLDPSLDMVPDPEIVVSGARELERLEAEFIKKNQLPRF